MRILKRDKLAYEESKEERAQIHKSLLPCPFCGRKPKMRSPIETTGADRHYCTTISCECGIQKVSSPYETRGDGLVVISRIEQDRKIAQEWNKRVK